MSEPFVKLSEGFGATTESVKKSLENFGSNKYLTGTKEFLTSNSLIAKLAFLCLVIVLFVLFLRLGVSLLGYFMSPAKSPKLVDGMKAGHLAKIIPQDPNASGSKPILRSVNQQDGIEFTWSVWLFIEQFEQNGKYKHIFHKGNDGFSSGTSDGMSMPNNAPGMYLDKTNNNLVVVMNTYNNITETITVNDIPLNKWINVAIRVEGDTMDTYVNGTIVNRHKFNSVPKQNYGDVYVNLNGGFNGLLSDLWYHDYALSISEIIAIAEKGPNMTMDKSMDVFPPYLSMRWYFNQ
jgi:hypothetical protein